MTLQSLRFTRLVEGRELLLPPLTHTPVEFPPSDEWFEVENISDGTLNVKLDVELQPVISSLVSIEVLSRSSNMKLSYFPLSPAGRIQLRVRATPRLDSKLPLNFKELPTSFGVLIVRPEDHPMETITLRGSLIPVCFSSPFFLRNFLFFSSFVDSSSSSSNWSRVLLFSFLQKECTLTWRWVLQKKEPREIVSRSRIPLLLFLFSLQ
jgi:hypothetical protein